MNKYLISIGLILTSSISMAAMDLKAKLTGPTQVSVGSSNQYQVVADNIGTVAMTGTKLLIYLPIQSTASGFPSNCSVNVKYVMTCVMGPSGTFAVGAHEVINFSLVIPAPDSNQLLRANIKGTILEYAVGNNTSDLTLNVTAPTSNSINITAPQNGRVEQCTFNISAAASAKLCDYANVTGYDFIFAANGVFIQNGKVAGTWSQSDAEHINIIIADSSGIVKATLNGQSVSPTCFEGEGTFPPGSTYHTAFRACTK